MIRYVIIVAGGSGSRMKNDIPKQFMLLHDKPVLMHAMSSFHENEQKPKLVLVLNEKMQSEWNVLCKHYGFTLPHHILPGGITRFHSVKNGLIHIFDQEKDLSNVLIAIHDGARPLVSDELIQQSFDLAKEKRSAIPAIQAQDSIRIQQENGDYTSIPREKVFQIQTPQVFHALVLKKAYEQPYKDTFTDDASVVDNCGYPIHITKGEIRNIKITYPSDLSLAEYWLEAKG